MKKYNVAVIGASGNVGREILNILDFRNFPIKKIFALASSKSEGQKLTYGNDKNFLNCTIGHELSHVIFDDHIEQSIKLSNSLKEIENQNKKDSSSKTQKEVKENIRLKLSRESEKIADINAAKMIINAGYPKETCIEELIFLTQSSKLDADTETDSTHPGFIERIAALEEFVDKYDLNREMRGFKPYKWTWSYDSKSKLLKFKPEPSDN